MNWIKERGALIFGVLVNLLFAMKLLKDTLIIKGFSYFYIIFLFLISLFIYWIYSYVLKRGKYRLIATGAIFLFLFLIVYNNRNNFYGFIEKEFINNFNELYTLTEKIQPTAFAQYKFMFILAFVLVVPLVLGISYKFNNLIILMNLAYVTSMWFLGYTEDVKKNLKMFLFISLFSSGIFAYSKMRKKLLKDNVEIKLNFKKVVIFSCIFSLIVSTISIVLPQNFKGKYYTNHKGNFVNRFAKNFQNNPLDVAKRSSYNLRLSGYSNNDKKLGGRIILDDKVAFEMDGNYIKYIRGSMKNYYNGVMWKSKNISYWKKENQNIRKFGVFNTKGIKKRKVKIIPKEIRSTSLLVPLNPYDIEGVNSTVYYDNTPVFISSQIQDSPYSVKYTDGAVQTIEEFTKYIRENDINYSTYFLGEMIYDKGEESKFRDMNSIKRENIGESLIVMSDDTLKIKYGDYLQMPNSVPERVYELTYDIVAGSRSSEEKVERIINYLNKNYQYTLEVFDVPEGRDFVDYFLFDEKKGYCTYFATAMTVMCRIAGVPARYSEGFKVDRKGEGNTRINVTNEEAHAWCEVLIDPEKDIWAIADASPTPVEYRRNKKKKNANINIDDIKINKNKNKVQDIQKEQTVSENHRIKLTSKQIKIIVTILASIGILALSYVLYKVKRRKIVKSNSIIPLYCFTARRLKSIDIVRGESIGDKEFVENIKDDKLREKLSNMVDVYYKEHYGNIIENNFNRKEFINFIEKYILSVEGKFKYYVKLFFYNFIP